MTGGSSDKARALARLRRKRAGQPAISPFAPDRFPQLPPVAGVRFASAAAGVRYQGRADVMLAELAAGSVIAGTFTRSETRSAPVLWCQERIAALADTYSPTPSSTDMKSAP